MRGMTRNRRRSTTFQLSMDVWMIGASGGGVIAGHPAFSLAEGAVVADDGCLSCYGDIDSDLLDYRRVNRCLGGPIGGLLSGRNHADGNVDLGVDLRDVATFQNGFTGP